MLRLTAIFVAACIVLIAVSIGAVVYIVFGLSGAESSIVGLAVLTALALYNTVSARVRDRSDIGDQITDLSRGTADLARQVAELGRRLEALENESAAARRRTGPDPLAAEIGEIGALMKQLAETVAAHENALAQVKSGAFAAPSAAAETTPPAETLPLPADARPEAPAETKAGEGTGPFKGKSREEIVPLIQAAVDAGRVDLYLQPILTLPQRKVRYYEGITRLRTEDGQLVLPVDFIAHSEVAGLMPKIDNLLLFRCVQVLRRLLVKNRDIGLFCNISLATLQDADHFSHFLQFLEANRALAPSLMLEFSQAAFANLGPIEQESLTAIAERCFRFSMDQVTDLRLEPRALNERGIRFVKVPAALLLNRAAAAADIDAADLSDLLGRYSISLIADKIESEAVVVDLLDYDVRFGQGFLFSPPRPVRAEALQGMAERTEPQAPAEDHPRGNGATQQLQPELSPQP
jgi:cyclic-di-GMP phosphodiesterase TipF (flagellum assembly factor)